MPRKKRKAGTLPSGNVRVQRRYKDAQGAWHTKSFTGSTRAEAEAAATDWETNRNRLIGRITVSDAIDKYIAMKEGVLSPNTTRSYLSLKRNYFTAPFCDIDLLKITNTDIQFWVSDLSARVSPKTVRNATNLLTAVLALFMPDFSIRITLPQKIRPDLYCPSAEEVRAVIDAATDPQVRAATILAAVGTMRRSEICALTWDDIHGNTIMIRRSLALDQYGLWVEKPPKTIDSTRSVTVTQEAIDALRSLPGTSSGRIFSYNPNELSNRFKTAVKHAGVHHFRFHDLRHFSASQMHLMGIPDKYIEARGGWKPGSSVMKRTYQEVISLEQKKQDKKILEIFSAM